MSPAISRLFALTLACLALTEVVSSKAQDKKPEKRVMVGKLLTESASLVRRESPDKPWQVVKEKEELQSGDLLLRVGPDAVLESRNGAVRMTGLGEMLGISSFPVIETAFILHDPGDADLEFTLDRGRVELTNRKEKGAARVRVRIRDKTGEIVLAEPGARMALEIYGRWPKGVPFSKNPKPGEGPALAIVALALKGDVELKGEKIHFHLKAPPGPALFIAESLEDGDHAPKHVEKLPEWAGPIKSLIDKKRDAMFHRLRELAVAKTPQAAVAEFLQSKDPLERIIAVNGLAALDDLEGLSKAMRDAKTPDVQEAGVLALRHWIGRGPGQDQKLYQALIDKAKFTPGEAEICVNLLHSFGDEEIMRPELYETLIDYLEHHQAAVRGFAHWHLVRLAPAGRLIPYNPVAPKEERDKAVLLWRKLIPVGKLPLRLEGKDK